jgi:hypothetical protein
LTCLGLNLNPESFGGATLSLLCGELRLLIPLCVGDKYDMAVSDKDHGRNRRLGVEDQGWPNTYRVLGARTIEMSDNAVCGMHHAQGDEYRRLFGWASKQRSTVSPGLGLKTGCYGLVIWASKSPWRFLALGIKTKGSMVCRLRHKTDRRMKTTQNTRRDLAACFTWKQVGLWFLSLTSRLVEARHGWCTWSHRRSCVELKTDGSMRRTASDSSIWTLPFSLY